MSSSFKRASSLFTSGARPHMFWGSQALGLAPAARTRIRTAAARTLGCRTQGRCVTTLLAIARGPGGDPGSAALADHGIAFRDVLAHFDPSLMPWLRRCWIRHLVNMRSPASRWSQAVGPIGGVVASLLDAGWYPCDPGAWAHPGRERYLHIGDPTTYSRAIAHALGNSEQARLWTIAAAFRNGGQLHFCLDPVATKKCFPTILKRDGPGRVGAALCVASVGSWTQ